MIDREGPNRHVTFCCDECGEVEETLCEDFHSALAKAKAHGWTVRRGGEDWQHFCRDCAP